MKKRFLILMTLTLLLAGNVFSETPNMSLDQDYFDITETTITEEATEEITNYNNTLGLSDIILSTDELIAIGEKIYKIIRDGRPVIDSTFIPYSILPAGLANEDAFHDMYGWSAPEAKTYRITYLNAYKMKVVEILYSVTFQWDGRDGNGGKYLTGIKVIPLNVKCLWGFNVNATSQLLSISNVGTRLRPIAAATLLFNHTVESMFKATERELLFYITGNGLFRVYDE